MNRLTLGIVALSAVLSSAASAGPAAAPAKAATSAKGVKPAKITCEEFLSLDEVVKPKVVYWAEGFSRKGKPEDATFDVESTDKLVPVMIEVCQKTPKDSFWKKVKAEFKKAL